MRDIRISLLLMISFVLLLASFLVLCIWGYRFYNSRDAKQTATVKTSQAKQDSLLLLYNHAIGNLEQKLVYTSTTADSLGQNIEGRLREFYRLKDELTQLLQNATTNEDFAAARSKIGELQRSIAELKRTNQNISSENARLYDLLSQMRTSLENSSVQTSLRTSAGIASTSPVTTTIMDEDDDAPTVSAPPSRQSTRTPFVPAVYTATDLSLEKVNNKNESEHLELVGSFAIKNNPGITTNDDLMIVVIQPNGKVLQKSAWESGTFQTSEGKKIYSCKMRIENPQGPVRKVTFSLNGDKSLTGNYVLQVYHKGMMIGNISKRV